MDVFGSKVIVPVEDHCLIVLEVELVSIFTNDYDRPAAEKLAAFLRARGIPVDFVSSPEEVMILNPLFDFFRFFPGSTCYFYPVISLCNFGNFLKASC